MNIVLMFFFHEMRFCINTQRSFSGSIETKILQKIYSRPHAFAQTLREFKMCTIMRSSPSIVARRIRNYKTMYMLQTSDFRDIFLNRIAEKVNQYLSGCVPVDEKYGTLQAEKEEKGKRNKRKKIKKSRTWKKKRRIVDSLYFNPIQTRLLLGSKNQGGGGAHCAP